MTYLIYCHTNRINGMRYVGYTKHPMMERWRWHVHGMMRSECDFYRALREYGPETFDHDVICDGVVSLKDAKTLERHYIEMLNTWKGMYGYNMTRGGNGAGIPSLETRKKHSVSMMGKRNAQGTKRDPVLVARLAESNRNPSSASCVRKSEAAYAREKVKRAQSGIDRSHYVPIRPRSKQGKQRPVEQLSLQKELIAVHANVYDIPLRRDHVEECCDGKRHTHAGFRWRWGNAELREISDAGAG